jgi:hypothetical protein
MSDNSNSNSGDPDHHFAPASPPSNTDYRHARWRRPAYLGSSHQPQSSVSHPAQSSQPNIVVVGVCSSGKSTLVRNLKERGFAARAVSQEHSYVPHLWQRSNPDVLVYLDATAHTIRGRGRTRWRQSLLDEEHRRLEHARHHCDLYIPTDGLAPEDVASRVITYLKKAELRNEQARLADDESEISA